LDCSLAPIPDYGVYPDTPGLTQAAPQAGSIALTWADGYVSEFHYIWLRDSCPCPACVNAVTREQTFEIFAHPDNFAIDDVSLTPSGALSMVWNHESHRSLYHPGWLRAHCYSEAARCARRLQPRAWGQDMQHRLPVFRFAEIMDSDTVLLHWLRTLRDDGVAVLRETPLEKGLLRQLAQRISFLRRTNFGDIFDVQSDPDANSNAFTSLRLPLHCDLPTRELQPGFQFLHCLENRASGGDSILVDGFRVARSLQDEKPAAFRLLSTRPVEFRNRDRHYDYRCKMPMIRLDEEGNLREIRLANFLRGPLDLPANQIESFYHAYREFYQMFSEDRFLVRFRLQPGDIETFDNGRVMHARDAFDPSTGERLLQGCYVDRDEVQSRIRILEREEVRSWL